MADITRKLATVARIVDLQPIPGADVIEVATVRGWKVVVKKGEYKVDDLCVYCEIDSFLPIRPEFEFLRKSSYRKLSDGSEGFRIKTIKLKGQISQGIVFPLTILASPVEWYPSQMNCVLIGNKWVPCVIQEGMDVTEYLCIVKYDPPVPAELAGVIKGNFPAFLVKTDEERIQNMPQILDDPTINDLPLYVTEKLDGSSGTFYLREGEFGVCSRNVELMESESNSFWRMARCGIELEMRNYRDICGYDFALQGELIGEGIQGNPYKMVGQKVYFFNLWNISESRRMPYSDFLALLNYTGLEDVPILETSFRLKGKTMEDMLLLAEGRSDINDQVEREGIVVRTMESASIYSYLSFKVINNKRLLKEKD